MSHWTYDPKYSRYTEEYYYQQPVLGTTSCVDLQSSQTYSEVQYQSQYGCEQNRPYSQGQAIAGGFDNLWPSGYSTNAYENRYTALEPNPAVAPHYQQDALQDIGTSKSRSTFHRIAKKPSESTTQIPSDRPTGYVTQMASHSKASGSVGEIGVVHYDDKTQEYRYQCNWEGCITKSMGRVQELKRHFDTFHGSLVLTCPVSGCEHTTARRDKLQQHCLSQHGSEYDL